MAMTQIKSLERKLNQIIAGQEEYCNFLAFYGYKLELFSKQLINKKLVPIPLIIGASGTGKTYGMQVLAKLLDINLIIFDGSTLTKAGFKGNNISETVSERLTNIPNDEVVIILFDEIDKCNEDYRQDALNTGIIYSDFLKLLETDTIFYKNKTVSTKNIFFAFSGSFGRIARIKKTTQPSRGYDIFRYETEHKKNNRISNKDLYNYGLNDEFLGRITTIIETNPLTKQTAKTLMQTIDKNLFRNINNFLLEDGLTEVNYTKNTYEYILNKLTFDGTGVREINKIINNDIFDAILMAYANKEIDKADIVTVDSQNDEIKIICSTIQNTDIKNERVVM